MASNNRPQSVSGYVKEGDKDSLHVDTHRKPLTPRTPRNQTPIMSRPTTTEGAAGAEDLHSFHADFTEGVAYVNHVLEHTIDALRLRISFGSKQHEQEKAKLVAESKLMLQAKDQEIDKLQVVVLNREDTIAALQKERVQKDRTMKQMGQEIITLKGVVKQAEEYISQLGKHFTWMEKEKGKNEDQKQEIVRLTEEVSLLKRNAYVFEQEMAKAHERIQNQGDDVLKLLSEKDSLLAKFQGELDKSSRELKMETKRMRESMDQHYKEMKGLRQQNNKLSSDVEILRQQNDSLGNDVRIIRHLLEKKGGISEGLQDERRVSSPRKSVTYTKQTLPPINQKALVETKSTTLQGPQSKK